MIRGQERNVIKDYIHELVGTHKLNGVISIEEKDEILYREAFGLAHFEHHVPNTLDTKFLIGSNSKLFATVAIFQLIERGVLALDAPIGPFFPEQEKLINKGLRVHHLLSHTGGIKDFFAMEGGDDIQFVEIPRDKLLIKIFSESSQEMGEYSYSNAGFYLLGLIIELISGISYADYISENIFAPLGMDDTGVYDQKSTLDDLAKWLRGLAGNQLVTSASFRKISSPVIENYGYGCRLGETGGIPYIWHDGFIKGHYSHIRLYPTRNIRMMILRNSSALSSHVPDELDPNSVCSHIAGKMIPFSCTGSNINP